jgi:hypothetical protein
MLFKLRMLFFTLQYEHMVSKHSCTLRCSATAARDVRLLQLISNETNSGEKAQSEQLQLEE